MDTNQLKYEWTWDALMQAKALEEGWGLWTVCGSATTYEIQRWDEAERFADDLDALHWVGYRAALGDIIAEVALLLLGKPVPTPVPPSAEYIPTAVRNKTKVYQAELQRLYDAWVKHSDNYPSFDGESPNYMVLVTRYRGRHNATSQYLFAHPDAAKACYDYWMFRRGKITVALLEFKSVWGYAQSESDFYIG